MKCSIFQFKKNCLLIPDRWKQYIGRWKQILVKLKFWASTRSCVLPLPTQGTLMENNFYIFSCHYLECIFYDQTSFFSTRALLFTCQLSLFMASVDSELWSSNALMKHLSQVLSKVGCPKSRAVRLTAKCRLKNGMKPKLLSENGLNIITTLL